MEHTPFDRDRWCARQGGNNKVYLAGLEGIFLKIVLKSAKGALRRNAQTSESFACFDDKWVVIFNRIPNKQQCSVFLFTLSINSFESTSDSTT